MSQGSSSLKAYVAIFAALLVLTGVTVAVAYKDVGHLGPFVAVGIAGLKATLVGAYFMHLRSSSKVIVLWALSGVFFLGIMMVITMGEFLERPRSRPDPLPPAAVHPEAR
jgi:cytochrome c oxidase subunit IV